MDDFTQPDPAQTDEDEGDIPAGYELIHEDVSCENCQHRGVCAYFAALQAMIHDPKIPGEPPFAVKDLAVICEYYAPDDAESVGGSMS